MIGEVDYERIGFRMARDIVAKGCWQPEKHTPVGVHYGCFICWRTTPAGEACAQVWKETSAKGYGPDIQREIEARLGVDLDVCGTPAFQGQDPLPVTMGTAQERGVELAIFGLPVK